MFDCLASKFYPQHDGEDHRILMNVLFRIELKVWSVHEGQQHQIFIAFKSCFHLFQVSFNDDWVFIENFSKNPSV